MDLIDDKKYWDEKTSAHPSFLQSWQWGELQKNIGRRIFRIETAGFFAQMVEQKLPLSKTYFYAPHGPVITKSAASFKDLAEGAYKAAENGAKPIFLRVEPLNSAISGIPAHEALAKAGFRETKAVQPKSTIVIDLLKAEKDILDGMEHDTRYSIRAAEKRGVIAEFFEGGDKKKNFEDFWEIFSETNRRHGLKSYPKKYYEEVSELEGECRSKIALARVDGKAVSAAIFVYSGERAFYLFAGSLPGYGRFNAPTYLLWQAIRDAKNSGFKYFDFWGISGENKNWAGITAFKKSFGGEEATSAGTWDYVYNKPFYFIYNAIKAFRK